MNDLNALREEILRLTREYSLQVHGAFRPASDPHRTPWEEGNSIPYAGRVFAEDEVEALYTLDWLTLGTEGSHFKRTCSLGVHSSLWLIRIKCN